MASFSFNATNIAPDPGMIAIPDNWYNLVILKAPPYEPNNDDTGYKIAAEISVADGPYKGRIIFHNFNVQNPSEKAQNIGIAQLSALSHAIGNLVWTETAALCNVVFRGKVVIEPANGPYPEKNKMMAFKHMNDPTAGKTKDTAAAPARPTAPPPVQAPPPQQAATTWAATSTIPASQQAAMAAAAAAGIVAAVAAVQPPPTQAPEWQPTPQAWDPAQQQPPAQQPPPVQAPPVQQAPPPQQQPPQQAAPAADTPPWAQ